MAGQRAHTTQRRRPSAPALASVALAASLALSACAGDGRPNGAPGMPAAPSTPSGAPTATAAAPSGSTPTPSPSASAPAASPSATPAAPSASAPQAPDVAGAITAVRRSEKLMGSFTAVATIASSAETTTMTMSFADYQDPSANVSVRQQTKFTGAKPAGAAEDVTLVSNHGRLYVSMDDASWDAIFKDDPSLDTREMRQRLFPLGPEPRDGASLLTSARSVVGSVLGSLSVDDSSPNAVEPAVAETVGGVPVFTYRQPGLTLRIRQASPHRLVSLKLDGPVNPKGALRSIDFSPEGQLAATVNLTRDQIVPEAIASKYAALRRDLLNRANGGA